MSTQSHAAAITATTARPLRGLILVLIASVLWGTTGTAQTFATDAMPPALVGAVRLAIASVLFIAIMLVEQRRSMRLPSMSRQTWAAMFIAGLCMAAYNLTFFAGVKLTGVAVGTVVAIGSSPIWAGVLQACFAGRAPGLAWWAGTTLAVIGGAMLVLGSGESLTIKPVGIAMCLLCGLAYAVYALVNKHAVARVPSVVFTAGAFVAAAAIAAPIALVISPTLEISARNWMVVFYLGIFATAIAYLVFSAALKYVEGTTGVTLSLLEPITAFVLAIVVVGERPGWISFAGLAVVLIGLLVVIRTEFDTQKAKT